MVNYFLMRIITNKMEAKMKRRITRQKRAILEELKKVKTHPTAKIIFKMVKRRMPSVSFGTVYRNLNLLKNECKILELASGKRSSHYDGDTRDHCHFFCTACKKIYDLDSPTLNDLDKTVSERSGFLVSYHRIDFYGYCKKCNS